MDDPDGEGAAWAYPIDEEEWPPEEAATADQGVYAYEEAADGTEHSETDALSEEQAQAIYAQMQG
eukprot:4006486-Amphidinium_carterae.1